MLGKLIKHELRATARILVPLYLVLFFLSIINRILMEAGKLSHRTTGNGMMVEFQLEGFLGFLSTFMMAIQNMLIFAVLITTTIFLIIRFYKNLLSAEGYLMFTLPVKTHQLITSKLLTTLFWIFASFLVISASLYIIFGTLSNTNLLIEAFQRLFTHLNQVVGGQWVLILIELILLALITIVGSILLVYLSIALGQLFKHKIIASFIAFTILYNVLQFLMFAAMFNLRFVITGNEHFINIMSQTLLPTGIIFGLIACIAFFGATNYIFKRKLNLE